MIIKRWECDCIKELPWTLLYGRRKTGKTWLLQNCINWDTYVTLTPDAGCLIQRGIDEAPLIKTSQECPKALAEEAHGSSTIVIDEVQRATPLIQEIIASQVTRAGRAYLAASGMGAVKRILGARSPLLGHFKALKIESAHLADTVQSIKNNPGLTHPLKWALLVKDPWMLRHVSPKGFPEDAVASNVHQLHPVAQGLVGEVFRDEERTLTRTYETLITLIARGEWSTQGLSSILYNIGLTPNPHPSNITSYLNVLEHSGLVDKTRLWKTRGARTFYRISTPILATLLSMPEPVTHPPTLGKALRNHVTTILAREAPHEIARLLAHHRELVPAYTILPPPRGDIDIVLLDHQGKPHAAYEVKMGRVGKEDTRKLLANARALGIPRTGVVSLTQDPPEATSLDIDEALGPQDILKISEKVAHKLRSHCAPKGGRGLGVGSINPAHT